MKRTVLALLPLCVAACATKSSVKSLPSDAGTKEVYKESFEKLRLATQDSTGELGFKFKEAMPSAENEFWYVSSQGLSSGTSGRWMRVRIVKGTEMTVYVVIRSKAESREATQTDELIEKDIHKRIAGRLAAK